MSGKMGLIVGLMIGFVVAVAASVTTMIVISGELQARESKAYEAGLADGSDAAKIGQGKVSNILNKAMLEENADRARRADEAKAKLKELVAMEALPEPAKAKAQEAMDALGQ